MKKTTILCIIAILFIFTLSAFAQTPEITNGLTYLYSTQNPDGSWDAAESSADGVPATVAAIGALQELDETLSQNYIDAVSWLQGLDLDMSDDLAGRLNILPAGDSDRDMLLSYLDGIYSDAWGGCEDFEANNLDTVLALLALHKVDYPELDIINYAFAYLIDNQNTDGGFGFYSGDDSNTYMTALALNLFAAYNDIFDFQDEVNDTAAYLLAKQNADGGFGSSPSTVYETSIAFNALTESGQDAAMPLQDAINYIQTSQQLNGSWDDDPYSTALALQALANVKPNLTVSASDISFSNPTPTAGDTITVTAVINNTGAAGTGNVLVRFYDGDPLSGGVLIDEATIVSIDEFASGQASIDWTTSVVASMSIYVEADPLDIIDEIDEADNIADKGIYVGSGPNLVVLTIDFSPKVALINEPVDISFVVNNQGESMMSDVLVEFHHAEGSEEQMLSNRVDEIIYSKAGETIIPELAPGASYTINTRMTFNLGFHNIKVITDPLNTIIETVEDDNDLSKWITALPEETDLIVNSMVVVRPKDPKENDDIAIFAQVYNYGGSSASSVNVSLYDGDPDAGGVKIDEVLKDIPPLEYQQIEFHASLAQGVHEMHIVADPDNNVIEGDELNNRTVKSITVGMASYVDFAISNDDISFAPTVFLPGDVITITAAVSNLETQTETTTVSFYEGNPSFGGTKIKDETVTISGGSSADVSISYTVPHKAVIIFVMLDETDLVYEKRETNNKAFKSLSIGLPDLVVRDKDIKINRMSDGSIYISPLIRNLGGLDASNISVSFYDGNPLSGGTLIEEQLIDQISAGSAQRINVPYTLSAGRHNIYVIADPADQIDEVFEANNTGMKVVYKTDINGPDIAVTDIDSTGITADVQELTVNGLLDVTLENTSLVDASTTFTLTAYEDLNNNSYFDNGIDNQLGETVVDTGLTASEIRNVLISIDGRVMFRDNHIHVMADSTDAVTEYDEENNYRHHKEDCSTTAEPVENFEVVEKWIWTGSEFEPLSNMVRMAPLVANMNDDNGDGIIDEEDIADIIFVSQEAYVGTKGVLRVISGKDGEELWSTDHSPELEGYIVGIAVGDIDNDGAPEIIVPLANNRELVAYNHDGSILWTSESVPYPYIGGMAPMIADMNNDGNPEIAMGRTLFNNRGEIVWSLTVYAYAVPIPIAVDLNNDDVMEMVRSSFALNYDGTTHWFASMIGSASGYNAIGNFDDDNEPEVVYTGTGRVDVLEHDKTIKWTFKDFINLRYEMQSAPAVGDVDGDGTLEIAVNGHYKFTVFNSDGTLRWEAPVFDATGGSISPVFFDLNGDGNAEIAVNDGKNFFIFNGDTGDVIFSTPNPASTAYEIPAVADIDNDGHVELIVFGGMHGYDDPYYGGIRIFGEKNDKWVSSRRIWNQHSYHVTNIDEDGYIPLREEDSWKGPNCYRCNIPLDNALDTPDLTTGRLNVSNNSYPEFVTLTARIGNAGTLLVKEGAEVSFYNGDPAGGGTLLGRVSTSRHLNPEEYEDVSFSWYYPAPGRYDIFVVADIDNEISECDELNNSASFQITLGDRSLPDLSVSSADIAINPADPVEGQSAVISAYINNIGDADALDVTVSFYDGAPQNGGTLIDSVTGLDIVSGTGATVQAAWNTLGQSGINFIYIITDPQGNIEESNENNNLSLISVEVSVPVKPDPVITAGDISFSNLSPNEGEPLTITAVVHNNGTAVGNINAALYDGPGGAILGTDTIAVIIPFGGEQNVSFDIDTVGLSGSHDFYITIDPDDMIDEQNEDNNSALSTLIINSSGLDIEVAVNKTGYLENEDVIISVNVSDNQNVARDLTSDVRIIDFDGYEIKGLSLQSFALTPLGSDTLTFTWNTGTTLVGDYYAEATVYDSSSNPIARRKVSFNIASSSGISSGLVLDKISYSPNMTAGITSTVTNNSVNMIFENLTATLTVKDPLAQILYTEERVIFVMTPLSLLSFDNYWYTSANPAGVYPVTIEVKDPGDNILSVSTTILTISSDLSPSQLLIGEISVDRQSLLQGETVGIEYSISNVGNVDLSEVDVSIPIVHVVELTPYYTLTDWTALNMGATYTNAQSLTTQTYSAKNYLVILRASIDGNEETLASAYFRVEGAPSAPSLNRPIHGEDVETLIPGLIVNNATDPNDDELTYEFELYEDESLRSLVHVSDLIEEEINITQWQVRSDLQENEWYYWRARAFDGLLYSEWMVPAAFRVNVLNDPPTAPTVSSPADGSAVDTFMPVLTVNNASDQDSNILNYNFDLALDMEFTQIVASEVGIFEGEGTTSWQASVNLSENTYYYWRSQADDWFIEGPWMVPSGFFVNTANDAPSVPLIIDPADGSELEDLMADITISNSVDAESDPLTYAFKLDTVMTFDSTDLVSVSGIAGNAETTTWSVTELIDNTWHYVRAKASDGQAESLWSEVISFFTNTINDPPSVPVLANPSDGSGVNVFTPALSVINSTDIDGDVLTYEFEVYADSEMANIVNSALSVGEMQQITSWTVSIRLQENRTYYWRGRAFDGELYSNWPALSSFMVNTANDAPGAPTLNAPAEGESIEALNPALSINNAADPDSDILTYDFEIYENSILIDEIAGIPEDTSGVTAITINNALSNNTTYQWRARAYDGDRYGSWMDMAAFSVHMPVSNITATIDFDPDTLDKKSNDKWVVVYIELPDGHNINDIDVSSVVLGGVIPAEPWPYNAGDDDNDGIPDLMVKFSRADVIELLPNGDDVIVEVSGLAGDVEFEGFDIIRVIKLESVCKLGLSVCRSASRTSGMINREAEFIDKH